MRKLWFSSFFVAALFAIGCNERTATETENTDTSALNIDTTISQPDHTMVNADTVPMNTDTINTGNEDANPATNGDSKLPGPKPKPGKMSHTDSIKASYPPKK